MTVARSLPQRVGVVGLGHVGLVTGLAFAARGLSVVGFDTQPRVRAAVARGNPPFHEPGLRDLLRHGLRTRRFRVVGSLDDLVATAEAVFLCVPTPSRRGGAIDLRFLCESARDVGTSLQHRTGFRLVVVKSTVVPGTAEKVVTPIVRRSSGRTTGFAVASNPEFLSEGSMVRDALRPERVVIGTRDARALAWLRRAYRPFGAPIFSVDPSTAELVKYASNAFLALKVSFANEFARIADELGVDVDTALDAVGRDPRIGRRFLRAGPGFGGSCFDKDLRAFLAWTSEKGLPFRSGETALRVNDEQLQYALRLIRDAAGPLAGKEVALLGLSFKAGTEDVRESRAVLLATALTKSGARVRVHDPVALENFRREWERRGPVVPDRIRWCPTITEALSGADAAVLQADWPEYLRWPPAWSRTMRRALLIDLRRAVPRSVARRAGLTVVGLGSGTFNSREGPRSGRGSE